MRRRPQTAPPARERAFKLGKLKASSGSAAVAPHDLADLERAENKAHGRRIQRLYACPRCHADMVWSNYASGIYKRGWRCDNVASCGSTDRIYGKWRWFCAQCEIDYCGKCKPGGKPCEAIVQTQQRRPTSAPAARTQPRRQGRPFSPPTQLEVEKARPGSASRRRIAACTQRRLDFSQRWSASVVDLRTARDRQILERLVTPKKVVTYGAPGRPQSAPAVRSAYAPHDPLVLPSIPRHMEGHTPQWYQNLGGRPQSAPAVRGAPAQEIEAN